MRIALPIGVLLFCVLALPAAAKHNAKHVKAPQTPDTCLSSDETFAPDNQPAVKFTLKNTCSLRFRCDVHLNVTTAMGNSLVQGEVTVEDGNRKKPATAVRLFPINGGSGGMIQESRSCTMA